MSLPKHLTTVTPFSKIIALLLFIFLPFLGFILGMKYQQAVTPITVIETQKIVTPAQSIAPSAEPASPSAKPTLYKKM